MLWMLFWAPKTYAKNYGLENIHNFMLKISVNLKLCVVRSKKKIIFFYFSTKTYVVGTLKNCLNETVLLSTQNTCLNWWVRYYLQFYTQKISIFGHIMLSNLGLWLVKSTCSDQSAYLLNLVDADTIV